MIASLWFAIKLIGMGHQINYGLVIQAQGFTNNCALGCLIRLLDALLCCCFFRKVGFFLDCCLTFGPVASLILTHEYLNIS
jgi:hypothetical protein